MPRAEETRAAWLEALAEMEALAGRAGDPDFKPSPFTPTHDLGPLPLDLVERAQEVQAAQRSALQRVLDARRRVVKHITALKTVPAARDRDASVYLDASA
ncbi:hypothetical protein [Frondihabitans australicus]|uniref:Uncharacterized protein n=1 Tax=Frondihabitans australicus TaxID=386892 RepID=A0A495IHX9_9MICO|nr:hypothetical protein [Frondihabitans australicus]RKR75574.1 hypothetical protein C8E83_2722 [Frondihabitans australicus]